MCFATPGTSTFVFEAGALDFFPTISGVQLATPSASAGNVSQEIESFISEQIRR
jgi:hypothetical protein